MKGWWWKFTGVLLLLYTIVYGLVADVPQLNILEESIRNLFFHVPMWFAMMFMMMISLVYSIMYLANSRGESQVNEGLTKKIRLDIIASQWATVALLFGFLGLLTGSVWARTTWSAWWVFQEVKLNGAAAGILVYVAYFILRGAIEDEEQKARVAAVYNIFAFVMYMVLINVIPRIVDSSLHPGNGGNPGFSAYDLDSHLRLIFYPAVIGWILLAAWIVDLRIRVKKMEMKNFYK
ncbi:MAG: cytochrome c biogenesis protein CcsA [Bacteroidetes bacterium]|nr:cytochrome c biogenesis protein CcsA [Bacteroidota bacterium]